jgi:hypothetical protein
MEKLFFCGKGTEEVRSARCTVGQSFFEFCAGLTEGVLVPTSSREGFPPVVLHPRFGFVHIESLYRGGIFDCTYIYCIYHNQNALSQP